METSRPNIVSEVDVSKQHDQELSDVAKFFDKKSVFITGAAGYVGAVLLETLLRCCPGIEKIYILLREKKGVQPELRKETIFKKKIFQPLSKQNPELLKKVIVVEGDVSAPYLGLNSDDLDEVKRNVSVLFHCAAVISFMKPLRYMLIQNVLSMQNVIDLCKEMTQFKALVHTSTAYSNCNRKNGEIEEAIYRQNVSAQEFLDALKSNASDEELLAMQRQCTPNWPNTYTFTKALAEDLLADRAADLPVAIVRPSIVLSAWKGIMPGYTEEGAGVIDVSIGIGKGFIRVLYCDEDKHIDIVPVDVVANALITASWGIAKNEFSSPFVVNCCSGDTNRCTWGHFVWTLYDMQKIHPLPKMYQKPSLVMRKHKSTYWVSAIVNHYAPAICIDLVLMLLRKKPRLTKLYRFYDLALNYLGFFLTNEWRFRCDNFQKLGEHLNPTDAKILPVCIEGFCIESIAKSIQSGAPFYQWENDKRACKDRLPIAQKRALITNFIKWNVIIWFAIFMFFLFTRSVLRTTVF